jgi:hypothetical protein
MKPGYIHSRARGDVTAVVWRDKPDIDILTNRNFCDEHGNPIKPRIIQDYN